MLKSLIRLLLDRQSGRYHHPSHHGYGSHPYKPWKKGKKDRRGYDWYPDPRAGYGPGPYGHPPHGYHRPRGIKGMILEAILHRLMKR
jgi:hypothetical protein